MQSVARRAGRLACHIRGFAAQAEVATAEQNAFLRFGSPFPAAMDLNPAVAQLPETKVSLHSPMGGLHESHPVKYGGYYSSPVSPSSSTLVCQFTGHSAV